MSYQRKTQDFWDILGFYGAGWEIVCCENSRKDAIATLKNYRENEQGIAFTYKKYREKIR